MAYNYKKKKFYAVQVIIGAGLFLLGVLLTGFTNSQTASFAIILGGTLCLSGFLNMGMLRLIYTPKKMEQESVEANDERNRMIREKSAWATQRIMLIVLSVVVVLVTFLLPFNSMRIVSVWGLLIINAFLPYVFAYIYSRRN